MGREQEFNHSGKHIYVGIDVHKKTYAVTVMAEHLAYPYKVGGMVADPDKFCDWLQDKFKGAIIHTAYEAGFSGFFLHRKLKAAGIDSIVVNPGSIEVAVSNHVKTDKRDSYKIAEHLFQKRIKGIHIPSKAQEEARTITRTRQQLTKKKTSIGNQIKSKLMLHGFIKHDDNRKMSTGYIKKVLPSFDLGLDLKIAVDCLASIYTCLAEQVKVLNKRIEQQGHISRQGRSILRMVLCSEN
jgi:transposase